MRRPLGFAPRPQSQSHWPILFGSHSDEEDLSQALKEIDLIRAYPFTLFVDAVGEVRAVPTGISKPATWGEYQGMLELYALLIECLLGEEVGARAHCRPSTPPHTPP